MNVSYFNPMMQATRLQGVVTVEMKPGCGLMELYGQPGAVGRVVGWNIIYLQTNLGIDGLILGIEGSH